MAQFIYIYDPGDPQHPYVGLTWLSHASGEDPLVFSESKQLVRGPEGDMSFMEAPDRVIQKFELTKESNKAWVLKQTASTDNGSCL